MTRSVADCALMLQTIAGYDAADPSSSPQPVPDYQAALEKDVRDLRAAVITSSWQEALAPAITIALEHSYSAFKDLGIMLWQVPVPILDHSAAIYNAIVSTDAYAIHADFLRTRRQDYGPMVWQRYVQGALVPTALYLKAHAVATTPCCQYA
jgi:aspartyl-tRNA(Asn)/glutamyl-tRNA(Gln) amidotransferase subunit A